MTPEQWFFHFHEARIFRERDIRDRMAFAEMVAKGLNALIKGQEGAAEFVAAFANPEMFQKWSEQRGPQNLDANEMMRRYQRLKSVAPKIQFRRLPRLRSVPLPKVTREQVRKGIFPESGVAR